MGAVCQARLTMILRWLKIVIWQKESVGAILSFPWGFVLSFPWIAGPYIIELSFPSSSLLLTYHLKLIKLKLLSYNLLLYDLFKLVVIKWMYQLEINENRLYHYYFSLNLKLSFWIKVLNVK
jgi:hypothetical protein